MNISHQLAAAAVRIPTRPKVGFHGDVGGAPSPRSARILPPTSLAEQGLGAPRSMATPLPSTQRPDVSASFSRRLLRIALPAVFLCCVSARAAEAESAVKLTGIANLGTRTVALLEFQNSRGGILRPILAAGERIESFEIVAINPRTAQATVMLADKTIDIPLGSAVTTDLPPTLHFEDADSRQLLEIYQELSERTLLIAPSLPVTRISLQSEPALGKVASLETLATALREKGIVVTWRTEKFAFATAFSQVPRLAQIPDPPAPARGGAENQGETFQPGLLKFSEADVHAVLDIYQELTGRTLLVSPDLPPAKITFKPQTSLTRGEAIWLLDSMLYLATIKMVPEWTKFTFALPATRNVKAPKIPDNPAADKLKESKEGLVAGALKFNSSTPNEALAAYAKLLGREPLTNSPLPAARFTMKTQTILHPVEAIYALDALAELNHLRFVLVGDKQVKIVHVSEAGKPAGNN